MNWVFKKSSGYKGYRCTDCGVWTYAERNLICNCNRDTFRELSTIEEAIFFVSKCHQEQLRNSVENHKIRLPVIVHPIEVMKRAYHWGVDDIESLFAYLAHDVLEDTLTKVDILEEKIGKKATSIVQELTFSKEKYKLKEDYINSFENTVKSKEAIIGKMADRYCNIADFAWTDCNYARKYAVKAIPIFKAYRKASLTYGMFGLINEDYNNLFKRIGLYETRPEIADYFKFWS